MTWWHLGQVGVGNGKGRPLDGFDVFHDTVAQKLLFRSKHAAKLAFIGFFSRANLRWRQPLPRICPFFEFGRESRIVKVEIMLEQIVVHRGSWLVRVAKVEEENVFQGEDRRVFIFLNKLI